MSCWKEENAKHASSNFRNDVGCVEGRCTLVLFWQNLRFAHQYFRCPVNETLSISYDKIQFTVQRLTSASLSEACTRWESLLEDLKFVSARPLFDLYFRHPLRYDSRRTVSLQDIGLTGRSRRFPSPPGTARPASPCKRSPKRGSLCSSASEGSTFLLWCSPDLPTLVWFRPWRGEACDKAWVLLAVRGGSREPTTARRWRTDRWSGAISRIPRLCDFPF